MTTFSELSKKNRPEIELEILDYWKKIELFQKGEEKNQNGEPFVFFEGPPTTNGKPGIHHVLARVFKDIYVRFQMQRGRHVPRRAGWDCHGLPVEREVEKKLGIESKAEIEEKIGLEKFNQLCRKSVLEYIADWDRFSERMAFGVDLKNPYFTMDNAFIESVWSLLKIIWDKGLIYEGYKVVPCDPVLGATMSDAEVDQGYKDTEDPSVTVAFLLEKNDLLPEGTEVLVWTTTPWTLPSNVALAVHPDVDYVLAEVSVSEADAATEKRLFLLAKELLASVLAKPSSKKKKDSPELFEHKIRKEVKGSDLAGLRYKQLLRHIPKEDFAKHKEANQGKDACKIVTADFVTTESGTGIVHIAPAYGADDLEVGLAHDLAVVHAVGLDGNFIKGTPLAGVFFKEADKSIIKELKEEGRLWKNERYKHSYPFGYRTGAPLLYYAKNAWYIRTTQIREELIKNNDSIHWVPAHIKEGRFGNWLKSNRDWALSRERYWGTPLPVWTDGEGSYRIIGSVAELKRLSGKNLEGMDLHRPYIDEITFRDPESGKEMRRVPEVIDCWFDSGSMPYAQWGWPIRGKEEFSRYFPADFISEAIDQTRGWFYTLLAVSTMVSGKSSYKNVVCLGHVLDEKGEKMSKSKGNIVRPEDVFDKHGADAIRWYFLTQAPAGNSRRVGQPGSPADPVAQMQGFFNMILNSAGFFVLYANVDKIKLSPAPEKEGWVPGVEGALGFSERAEMDRWILSALTLLVSEVTQELESYDSQSAGQKIESFVDSLSNWYIRRNRRRFWKGDLDADKLSAYDTLYTCLVTLAALMAPFTPFLSEELYRTLLPEELRRSSGFLPESIHLTDWPTSNQEKYFDKKTLSDGETVKEAAYLGRAARMQSKVKLRQPLSKLSIYVEEAERRKAIERNAEALKEELNIKEIEFLDESAGILEYRIKPNLPLLGKRLGKKVRYVQAFLKGADPGELAARVKAGEEIPCPAEDETLRLSPEEFLLESISKEGSAAVEGHGMVVALDTRLTDELIAEGLVRDLIRHVQELRKKSGLEVTDRVFLSLETKSELLKNAIESFSDYICEETLAVLQAASDAAVGDEEISIDSHPLRIQISKQ